MFGRRGSLIVLVALSIFEGGLGCETAEDAEPFHASKPGATQPEGGGDAVSERAACQRLERARSEVSADLDCEIEQPACPELIRPFGADPCRRYSYDEDSVDACVKIIESYEACEDFAQKPCLVTALIRPDATCDDPGVGGAAGGGGSGNTPTGGTGGDSSAGGGQAGAAGSR